MMKTVLKKNYYGRESVVQELGIEMFASQIRAEICCWANLIGIDPTPIFRLSETVNAILNIPCFYLDRASFLRRIIKHCFLTLI